MRHINMGVSCIICAYNEEPRIRSVLEAVVHHPLVSEIIVVDDGSCDGTGRVVEQFPSVTLISRPHNSGKTVAMAAGVAAVSGDIVMLLDADLRGIKPAHITALVEPVLSGKADVTISLRGNSLWLYRMIGLDFVSGERVLHVSLLANSLRNAYELPRFGIEVYMNTLIIQKQLTIAAVDWCDVTQARKIEKIGFWRGSFAEMRMIFDVLRVKYPAAALVQTCQMLRLTTASPVHEVFRVGQNWWKDLVAHLRN